jgi:4a-hydroxytetrahydrobiopterin dehydratase
VVVDHDGVEGRSMRGAPAYLSDAGASSTLSTAVVHVVTVRLRVMTIDPTKLASTRLTPADASTHPLTTAEAADLATGLDPAWRIDGDHLIRDFRFPTFGAAFGLATRIALLAESHNHHPVMEISWGRLVVTWSTDAIGALSENDFVMAAKVDRLVAKGLGLKD